TDHLGRCVLSRLIYGARISMGAAMTAMIITVMFGILIGVIAGYWGGWIDSLIMRLCDILMAFPSLVLALVLLGMMGRGLSNIIIAIVLVHWVFYARLVRGMVLDYKQSDFVTAAKVMNTPVYKII